MRTRNMFLARRMMLSCAAVALSAAMVPQTQAALISVADPSFEDANANDVATINSPSWVTTPAGLNGVFDPGNGQFAGTTGNNVQGVLPDGGQVGLVEDSAQFDKSTLSQKLGVNVEANTRYDLSVFVGDRVDSRNTDYSVQLLAGGVPIETWINPTIPANGTFQQVTMSAVADASFSGELEIRFAARDALFPSNTQVFFDQVSLNATSNAFAIPIEDASFELALANDVGTAQSPFWSGTPVGLLKVFDPGNNQFGGTSGNGANTLGILPDGGQIGLVENSSIFPTSTLEQTLTTEVLGGAEYTLSFWVGDRGDGFVTDYRVELLAGDLVILEATNPITPENGRFELVTLTGFAPGDASGLLSIRFSAPGGPASQTFFDDVSLFVVGAIVPEPASLTLLGLSVLALGRRRRAVQV